MHEIKTFRFIDAVGKTIAARLIHCTFLAGSFLRVMREFSFPRDGPSFSIAFTEQRNRKSRVILKTALGE